MTEPDFWRNFLIWRYSRKDLQIRPKSETLIFFSKTTQTIFLIFGLKLILNMTYFSKTFSIWRYLTSKSSKNWLNWGFWPFSRLCIISFLTIRRSSQWILVIFKSLSKIISSKWEPRIKNPPCDDKFPVWIHFIQSSSFCFSEATQSNQGSRCYFWRWGLGESKIFFKKCWPPWLSDKENFVPYSPKTLTFLTLKSLASIPHLYRAIIKNNTTLGYFCKKCHLDRWKKN